jgi:iron complex outermembrane receptor protein
MYTMPVPYTQLNMIPDVTISNTGIFADYSYPASAKLTAKGGFRMDAARAQAATSNTLVAANGSSRDFTAGAGNVQLIYRPVEGFEFFTGAAQGNRLPDQKELFISIPSATKNTYCNPNLKATLNNEIDLGVKYGSNKFYANASLFHSRLFDYINITGYKTGAVSNITYENIEASIWGAELGSQLSLPYNLFLRANLSYAEGQNLTGSRPLSEIPPLKGVLSVRYDTGLYFAEIASNQAGKQSRVDTAMQEAETPGWATTDIRFGYNYKRMLFSAGINNIFNEYYFTHLSYLRDPFASGVKVPENGQNFFITLTYQIGG